MVFSYSSAQLTNYLVNMNHMAMALAVKYEEVDFVDTVDGMDMANFVADE
jgi:hypothetical protein